MVSVSSMILMAVDAVLGFAVPICLSVYLVRKHHAKLSTILIGAGLILLFALKKRYNKKKIEELYTQLGELSNQLNLLYNGFSNCILPPEFTDPRILFKLQSLIISGRCVTIGNAINALLSVRNTYMRINQAKSQFQQDTAARFNGTPAFFNAVRYLDLR